MSRKLTQTFWSLLTSVGRESHLRASIFLTAIFQLWQSRLNSDCGHIIMSGHTKLVQPQLRLFIFSAVIILASTASSKVDKGQQLSRAHFEFSLDFYKSLLATETNSSSSKAISQNFVYSPYSLNTVLSMLFLGTSSSSNSSKQLRTMLHFDNISYVDVHNQFKKVVENFDENYYRVSVLCFNLTSIFDTEIGNNFAVSHCEFFRI